MLTVSEEMGKLSSKGFQQLQDRCFLHYSLIWGLVSEGFCLPEEKLPEEGVEVFLMPRLTVIALGPLLLGSNQLTYSWPR